MMFVSFQKLQIIVRTSYNEIKFSNSFAVSFRKQNERQAYRPRACTTPTGAPGLCQDVTHCPGLLLDLATLVRSICFQSLFRPGTCCPIRTETYVLIYYLLYRILERNRD